MMVVIIVGIVELAIAAIVMALVVSAPEPQEPVYDEGKRHSGLLKED